MPKKAEVNLEPVEAEPKGPKEGHVFVTVPSGKFPEERVKVGDRVQRTTSFNVNGKQFELVCDKPQEVPVELAEVLERALEAVNR